MTIFLICCFIGGFCLYIIIHALIALNRQHKDVDARRKAELQDFEDNG
jgi:hypothetical protein